jgi:plastocyanin
MRTMREEVRAERERIRSQDEQVRAPRQRSRWTPAALVLAACLGCGGGDDAPPPAATTATTIDPASAATIEVSVTYAGAPPAPRELNLRSTPACAAAHPGPVYDQSVVVRDGHLANVVVWISKGLEGRAFAPSTDPVVIDQRGCLYVPHVAAAMVGQPVEFLNSDTEAHNVHGKPDQAKGWNFIMNRRGGARRIVVETPEIGIPVGCDIHPWMQAYLAVIGHPFFGVTGEGGTVRLQGVPAGTYVVSTWHERLGTKEQPVTVEPKAIGSVQIRYDGA